MKKPEKVASLSEAIDYFKEMIEAHPERNMIEAYEAVLAGRRRRYPAMRIARPP